MNIDELAIFIIKYEALQRGLVGEIIRRIEHKGLKIIGMKMLKLSESDVSQLYNKCKHLSYFDEMLKYNSEGPVIAIIVKGPNGNRCANDLCGKLGIRGTIRGDYAMSNARNLLHCSEPDETVEEIDMLFSNSDIYAYNLSYEGWLA